jgi:DNA mismatch endonuclease, patch repair protein
VRRFWRSKAVQSLGLSVEEEALTDTLSPEKRSWNMSRIRSKDTGPERMVRSLLHHMGYRFSLQRKDLPGCPDIVLPKYRTVVLVHGCFFHRHHGCRMAYTPKSRQVFWLKKLDENTARDKRVVSELQSLGWRVIVVWECQTMRDLDSLASRLDRALKGITRNS